MDVKVYFAELDKAINMCSSFIGKVDAVLKAAVEYNIEHGTYKDNTGHLRKSNYAERRKDELVVGNSASYAAKVESKGYNVAQGGALYAEQRLKEITE